MHNIAVIPICLLLEHFNWSAASLCESRALFALISLCWVGEYHQKSMWDDKENMMYIRMVLGEIALAINGKVCRKAHFISLQEKAPRKPKHNITYI